MDLTRDVCFFAMGGFLDVERNLSALDLTSLNLAHACGCKAKVHVNETQTCLHFIL